MQALGRAKRLECCSPCRASVKRSDEFVMGSRSVSVSQAAPWGRKGIVFYAKTAYIARGNPRRTATLSAARRALGQGDLLFAEGGSDCDRDLVPSLQCGAEHLFCISDLITNDISLV